MEYLTANLDDIIEDAKKNNRVPFLKETANTTIGNRKITFMELKRKYFLEYYKEQVPVAKKKGPKMWDRINDL